MKYIYQLFIILVVTFVGELLHYFIPIPGGVGLVTAWGDLKDMMLPVVVITIISTIVVMAVTGKATELIMKTGKKKEGKKDE